MGHRLSRIYTRTGDDGSTGLGDGSRASKTDARVEAMGAVDETNAAIGLLLTEELPPAARRCLLAVQHDLFDLGGELSIPGHTLLRTGATGELETALDGFNQDLPPLKEFILPGGCRAAALAHLARTVCRRAERRVVALAATREVSPALTSYLNRLSDLLFVLARHLNRAAGQGDVLWDRTRDKRDTPGD